MKEGNVILAPIPQADGQIKNRPGIILRELPAFRDLLICGISTQLHQQVKDFDEVVAYGDSDFGTSGLVSVSLIRLSFLTTTPRKDIVGVIGSISTERHQRLLRNLSTYLTKKLPKC